MMLSNIASVATLILFVIYFVGRIITIIRTRDLFPDDLKIIRGYCNHGNLSLNIVESFALEEGPCDSFVLTSKNGIYDLSVYKLLYNENYEYMGEKAVNKCKYHFLNIGQSIEFRVASPEMLPWYEVEYYTPDYKKVRFSLCDNLKNGVMSEKVKPQNTWKSVLYHLFN